MKSFQLILLCFVCVAKSYGQGGRIVIEITKEHHKVYTKVIQSFIPRADSSWMQSLEKKLNQSIPIKKRAKKGKYIVSVVLIIDKDGEVAEVECENDPGSRMCEEVLHVIKKFQPVHGIK